MKYVMLGIFPILSNLILSSNCRAVTLGNKIRFCLLTSQCSSDLEGYWGLAKCSERSGGDCYQMWICPVVVLLITDTEIERDVAGSCIWSLYLDLWSRVWIWIHMEGSQHLCFLPDRLEKLIAEAIQVNVSTKQTNTSVISVVPKNLNSMTLNHRLKYVYCFFPLNTWTQKTEDVYL